MFTVQTLITLGIVYLILKLLGMLARALFGSKAVESKVVETNYLKDIASSLNGINKVLQKWEQVRRQERIEELNKREENIKTND